MYNQASDGGTHNTEKLYMFTDLMKRINAKNVYGDSVQAGGDILVHQVTMNALIYENEQNAAINFLTNDKTNTLYELLLASETVREKLSASAQDLDVQNLLKCLPLYFKKKSNEQNNVKKYAQLFSNTNNNEESDEEKRMKECVKEYKNKFHMLVYAQLDQHKFTMVCTLSGMFFLSLSMQGTTISNSFLFNVIMTGECIGGFYLLREGFKWYALSSAHEAFNGSGIE
jgi:hypothetical protein